MMEKIIVVAPTTAVPISTGLAVALKVLPAPSFSSSRCLARSKLTSKSKSFFRLALDVRHLLDQRELVDRLRVVGHRAVGVDGDGDRAHAEEAEGHQAEGEDGRSQHQRAEAEVADEVADGHQGHHGEAQVVAGEVAGHEARQNAERRAAFVGRGHDLAHVARLGRGEDLDQLGNDGAGQRAAGDDGRQLPPLRAVAAEDRDDQVRHDVGEDDGDDRSEPDQRGQRRFEVHLVGVAVAGLGNGFVQEVRHGAGDQHHDAHDEDPDQQLHLHVRIFHAQQDEGDQRHAGDAVSLEAVGAGADRVARVVAGAVGDDARVARVVFLDLEDDLHQVGADVGDLGEDAAGNTQRSRAQRLADGEADEALAGVVSRNEQQDAKHDEQLDRDQHHADAHAGLQRDGVDGIGLAAQSGERGARVGVGVHADAEPGHAVAADDADDAEQKNDGQSNRNRLAGHRGQPSEVRQDDDRDERPQDHQELALRDQVGLAGFVDQVGDVAHGLVDRHVLELQADRQAEDQAEGAEDEADGQQLVAVHAEKADRRQIGELQVGFAAGGLARLSESGGSLQHKNTESGD